MIVNASFLVAIGSGQQCVHLRQIQIGQFVAGESLEGNAAYLAAPCDVFRASFGDEASHRMHGGEPLVPCANGTSALLLNMVEEAAQTCLKIEDVQAVHRCLLLCAG